MKAPWLIFGNLYVTCPMVSDYALAHIWLTRQVHEYRAQFPDVVQDGRIHDVRSLESWLLVREFQREHGMLTDDYA